MNTNKAIKVRKSSLSFLSTPVERNKIETIVASGSYAPIFGEIHFTVIEDKDIISKINTTTINMMKNSDDEFAKKMANTPGYSPVYNAPTVIVLSALNGNDPQGFNMVNVSCAAENMLLSATDMELASRMVMAPVLAFMDHELLNVLKLPEGYIPLSMVLIGNTDQVLEERHKEITNVNYI